MTLEKKVDLCLRWIATQADCPEEIRAALGEAHDKKRGNEDLGAAEDFLREMGVNQGNQGWGYLRTAICLCLEDEGYLHRLSKRLYPEVARRHGTTYNGVERSIRHAIERAFEVGDAEAQYAVFGNATAASGKPTNGNFIAGCVHEIQRRKR